MQTRKVGEVVYIGGDLTPMIVMEPDTYRDWHDRTRRMQIKLRPENDPNAPGAWWRSDVVTGGQ